MNVMDMVGVAPSHVVGGEKKEAAPKAETPKPAGKSTYTKAPLNKFLESIPCNFANGTYIWSAGECKYHPHQIKPDV